MFAPMERKSSRKHLCFSFFFFFKQKRVYFLSNLLEHKTLSIYDFKIGYSSRQASCTRQNTRDSLLSLMGKQTTQLPLFGPLQLAEQSLSRVTQAPQNSETGSSPKWQPAIYSREPLNKRHTSHLQKDPEKQFGYLFCAALMKLQQEQSIMYRRFFSAGIRTRSKKPLRKKFLKSEAF